MCDLLNQGQDTLTKTLKKQFFMKAWDDTIDNVKGLSKFVRSAEKGINHYRVHTWAIHVNRMCTNKLEESHEKSKKYLKLIPLEMPGERRAFDHALDCTTCTF